MSMFGNYGSSTYNPSSNPFSTMNLDELQRNYQLQMERVNNMKQTQQTSLPVMEEINRLVSSMTSDEQSILMESHEYQLAKQTYEAGFMAYLSGIFSSDYMASPDGKLAAEGLLNTIRGVKDKITYEAKVKREKMDKMLELLDSDPEMRARYEQLTSPRLSQVTPPIQEPREIVENTNKKNK